MIRYSPKHTRFSEETYDFFILTSYKIFAESWIHSQFIAKTLFSRYSVTTKAMIDVVCMTGSRIMVATVSHIVTGGAGYITGGHSLS